MEINHYFEEVNKLSLDKSKWCSLGTFYRAFIERSLVLTKDLFPFIERSLQKIDFQLDITSIYNLRHNTKINYHDLSKVINYNLNHMFDILSNSYKNVHGSQDDTYITSNYKYYYIGSLLFDVYMVKQAASNTINMQLAGVIEEKYKNIDIDLNRVDSQFRKYKLLSLNKNIVIRNSKNSQTIKDNRLCVHFWIPVPRKLLFSFQELIQSGMISEISFRIDKITECTPLLEAMEQGSPLNLKVDNLAPLSKFYSKDNYADTFWVHHDSQKKSITFEELLDDFHIVNDDIITQVIHLEYYNLDNEFYIQHLDHELISYTLEQYKNKLEDSKIKGYKKTKSFKIDNASIPFMYKSNGEFLLLQVLDSYFKNSELVSEYFNEIV